METSEPLTKMTRLALKELGQEATKFLPPELPRPLPPGIFLFGVSMGVLRHFFDLEQFNRLVNPNLRKPSFLAPPKNGSVQDHTAAMLRVTDFAETLFNLQWIEGFHYALEEFSGADIQTAVHTLDLGMLFKQAGLRFRFRKALGTPGLGNHDIDLYHEGWTVPVETKAKRVSTKVSKRTLEEALDYAASKQLPRDAPSIIAIRLPSHWAQEVGDLTPIRRWIGNFLGSHPTIVRVVALLEAPGLPEDGPLRGFAVLDEPNHTQMFGAGLGGRMFTSDVYLGDRWILFKEFFKLVPRPSLSTVQEGRRMLNEGRALSPEYLLRLLQEAGIRPSPVDFSDKEGS